MEEHKEQVRNGSTKSQKALLYVLYFLLGLMVVFSLMALQNTSEEGYMQCVEKKCESKGEKFCSKVRELNNCCAGAGGKLAGINNPQPGQPPYTCVFE